MGFDGTANAGSAGSTTVWVSSVATRLPTGSSFRKRLVEEIADHPLGLGPEHIERVRPHVRVGLGLEGEEAHLRAVAVRDDEAMRGVERRDCLRRVADVGLLMRGLGRLAAAQQGVAAESDDRERPHRSPQARRMYA